jgi:hypothetical protein
MNFMDNMKGLGQGKCVIAQAHTSMGRYAHMGTLPAIFTKISQKLGVKPEIRA